jgi:hypothetical protein
MTEFDTHPEVTDADVLKAVGKAAGVDLTGQPETDVQQVLHGLDVGSIDMLTACYMTARIIGTRGVLHGDAADWGHLILKFGAEIFDLVQKLSKLVK